MSCRNPCSKARTAMAEPEPESGVVKQRLRRSSWLVCIVVFAFLMGMVTDIKLQERRWWEPRPTRSEHVLGDETDELVTLCSAAGWETLTAGSETFRFVEVATSDAGSFANAGGCEVHFEVRLGGEPAGEAVVEAETLESHPRAIPWGAPLASGCTRVFQASSDLFDQIVADDTGMLPREDACRISTDSPAGGSSATLWASREYGSYRDYAEITLIDLDPGNGDAAARAQAFSEFFTGEFAEVVDGRLPS